MTRKGFTLIEVLISTAILVLVVATIGGTLAAGIRALNAARHFQSAECVALAGLEKMEREIGSAVFSTIVRFDGHADRLTFRMPTCDRKDGMSVRYFFDSGDQAILRNEWAMPLAEYPSASGDTMVEGVAACMFSYGKCAKDKNGEVTWTDIWAGETNVPDAVRVDLRLKRTGDGEFTLRRTFLLFAEMPEEFEAEQEK